jgi:acetyltransferase-like isoleucine patch superfamily enzyme
MLLSKLFFKLYALKSERMRKVILTLVSRFEGGQMHSETLRAIFSKYHNIEIGMYSYGGCFNLDHIRPFTKIGRYCSFAENVYVYNANHPFDRKSAHPFFYDPSLGYVGTEQILRRGIEIGNDVWVGQNVIILPSVTQIGDGAVIGAGTVVTKNVPDFAVVVGNPGRVIKYRFTEDTIQQLKQERWWDKDIDDLRENLDAFTHRYNVPFDNAKEPNTTGT